MKEIRAADKQIGTRISFTEYKYDENGRLIDRFEHKDLSSLTKDEIEFEKGYRFSFTHGVRFRYDKCGNLINEQEYSIDYNGKETIGNSRIFSFLFKAGKLITKVEIIKHDCGFTDYGVTVDSTIYNYNGLGSLSSITDRIIKKDENNLLNATEVEIYTFKDTSVSL